MLGRSERVRTSLQAIAKKAGERPGYRFQNLYGMLNEEMLVDSWSDIHLEAASGVDGVSAKDYEQNLEQNVHELVEDLKQKRYRAKLVRRVYIPKGEGKERPLGIPTVGDKLLQLSVKRILEAIYEQDFLRCSYGYRPNVGPLDAADKLTVKLQFGKYNYVVEADIKGFFDNIDHEKLLEMLAERIDDKAMLWLIEKWLKAGVLETDGSVVHPITGTPQGGIISPLLANVYLHHVLDEWFQEEVLPRMNGEACLIRFADDFVCAFEKEEDAQRFYAVLGKRLGRYGLELSVEKTRIVPFSANNRSGEVSFDFLGFEYRWGKDRKGRPHVKRRTARKRLRKSLLKFKEWCRENRHLRLGETIRRVNAKFRGYYNYYGVPGNYESLKEFYYQAVRHLHKYLNRCSQRERFNWEGFKQVIEFFGIEKPRTIQKSPKAKMATGCA